MFLKSQIFIAFSLFSASILSAQSSHNIFINEFLASNVSVDADIVDFDDYSDWIELYNSENSDADISGYYLTDDPGSTSRWKIPQGTIIKAKGFLRFWADGYDNKPGNTYLLSWLGPYEEKLYFTTQYYHLNFKLSQAGEYIGLYNPAGGVVDSVSYGLQLSDISMGRKPDGSANWLYFGEPTPEASNYTQGTLSTQNTEPPVIAIESGFYSGNQIVTIQSGSNEADIKYTLDGSKPVNSSLSYNASVDISKTTVLRARSFENGKLPGSMVSRTYIINEDISLPVISIITPPGALWDEKSGIYQNKLEDREIPVTFEFFEAHGKHEFSLNAGLQLTGQASLYYPQTSFTIYPRERYGTDAINYQIFSQRKLNIFKALYLRNSGVPDNRSTMFRDAMQHTLVLNKMDIDCQAYQPSVVFLNGEYWGIYNIRDKINSDYIASLHNVNPEDVDMLEYEANEVPTVMNGNADNYNLFYSYFKTADLSNEANYRIVEKWMDINEYINYQICEIFYDNVFWPDQNMRMWRERKDDGKWRWILFDTDYAFGMPNAYSTGYTNNTLKFATSSNTGSFVVPEWATLIFRKLLLNEEFKTLFIQRFESYMNSIFQPDTVVSVITALQNRIGPEMARHIERWKNGEYYYGDPIPDYKTWLSNVEVMKDFARYRPFYMRQYINDYFKLSGSSVLNTGIKDPGMGRIRINDAESTNKNISGIYFRDVPVELKAIPEVGYQFVKWEGIEQDSINPVKILLSNDSVTINAVFQKVATNFVPSLISSDTVFNKDNSPYYATNDIVVDSNTTLTIESGVRILMPEEACIIVYGKLIIEGTREEPVTIIPNEYSQNWGALCFVNATDSSVISNLKISGATKGHDFERDKAAISGYKSDFSLRNVTVENADFPIFLQYGNVFIGGCTLHTVAVGDLINVNFMGEVVIENCDLSGNDDFDSDGIDIGRTSNGIVRGNRIYNIYGFNSDGIDLGEDSKNILIENNIIYNISDKGISIGGSSTATIKRNLIANCGQGVGIKDKGSYAYIENSTFYANQDGVSCFEKNIGRGGGDADIVSCIFANSYKSAVYTDKLSNTDVSFSLSNTDVLNGIGNLHGNPLLLNNLRLAVNSPAINSGNPSSPADPDGSPPDMGVNPFDQRDQANLIINEIHYNPVEGESHEFVEIVNGGVSSINITGFKLGGNISCTFPNEMILAGEIFISAKVKSVYEGQGYKVFQWADGDLPKGPGNILLKNNQGDTIDFVNYDSRSWWPEEPNGQGPSLELFNISLENMVSGNWQSSKVNGGTPGKLNSSVAIKGLYINEFLADNKKIIANDDGEFDDWIEFYNDSDKPVNMAGLYITDNLDNPLKFHVSSDAPELTTVPAKGFILFWADGKPDLGVLHLGFKLDAEGEQIGLVQECENHVIFLDSLTYSKQKTDISYGRYSDGSNYWFAFKISTPLQSNIYCGEDLAGNIILYQNYPNPFSSKTVIAYQILVFSNIELDVYNLMGLKVKTLVKESQQPGRYEVELDAEGMTPGIYFCELKAGHSRQIKKMIKIK
jgi:parallel beta-helix repeat protein